MQRAYVREREGGKYLATVRLSGLTFVSDRRSALPFDDMESAWAMALAVPFACDAVVLADCQPDYDGEREDEHAHD